MTNGEVIYVSPVDNGAAVQWDGSSLDPNEQVVKDISSLKDVSSLDAALMDFAGQANTAAIVAQLGDNGGRAYAAKVCADLVAYGFDDWYLPAAGELNQMYLQLSLQITQGSYWSSTESTGEMVWGKYFNDGFSFHKGKGFYHPYRCVRR